MKKLRTHDSPIQDVIVQGHGSIILLWPRTQAAKKWFNEHVEIEATWGEGIAVEPRYLGPILAGLEGAGLVYE